MLLTLAYRDITAFNEILGHIISRYLPILLQKRKLKLMKVLARTEPGSVSKILPNYSFSATKKTTDNSWKKSQLRN